MFDVFRSLELRCKFYFSNLFDFIPPLKKRCAELVEARLWGLLLVIIFSNVFSSAFSQELKNLTLDEVINLAKEQSPDAILSKHVFRNSYWEYRTYKASQKPSLDLNATLPEFNRSISKITMNDGSDAFIARRLANYSLGLALTQNVSLTGGRFFINSDLNRIDVFTDSTVNSQYLSTPISIGFMQPVFGFNSYRWEKKIEPLKYEEAKKEYASAIEEISLKAVNYFFDLALAQMNLNTAELNYSNNDTLYKMAQGRYNIGTIAQNELLQMELNFLQSGATLNESKLDLEVKKFKLRSFLGFNENIDLQLIVPSEVSKLQIDVAKAKEVAIENNPQMLLYKRQLIEAERDVAKAKTENRFNANLYASFGLTQSAYSLQKAYETGQDQQKVTVGIQVPVIDWGLGKGKYKMAISSQEVVKTRVEQALTDFEQDIFLKVMQFNMQNENVNIAAKSDTVAQMRYDISKQRFYIGKINVTDLTIALTEKDGAKRSYISELRNYWNYYYTIRKQTLYDFEKNQQIEVDTDGVLK